jgi:hypothetical protein
MKVVKENARAATALVTNKARQGKKPIKAKKG